MSTDPRVERALVLYNEVFLSLDEMSCATPKSFAAEAAFKAHLESMAAEIARLTAELEEARKDAGRYRVLRNRDFDFVVEQDRPGWRTTMPVGRGLDEAIDAAMTKDKS